MLKIVLFAASVLFAALGYAAPASHPMSSIETARRDNIARELHLYIGKTIALASAGKPYQEVIAHIGKPPAHHQQALDSGEGGASLYPDSALFKEITFGLGRGEQAQYIVSMEFIAKKGAFDMHDLGAAFGEWQRSPKEPEQATYAVAWFPKYDKASGARFFLYAEDGDYTTHIDPHKTPVRIFFQTDHFRWGD